MSLDTIAFSERMKSFRKLRGDTIESLAVTVGVKPITLLRWEAGRSKPSRLAVEQLRSLGFGDIDASETKDSSTPRLHLSESPAAIKKLRSALKKTLKIGKQAIPFSPSPYVFNGPQDQISFFESLYKLQERAADPDSIVTHKRRLSAVQWAGTPSDVTAQFSLEGLKDRAVHWNANYGSHGWHRYVGRFPPHLVRALLNHFELTGKSLVCDPFCGSGTTLTEARLLGIPAVGFDVCPLSCLISRAKSKFEESGTAVSKVLARFNEHYALHQPKFQKCRSLEELHDASGGVVPRFANDEKWFSVEAYAGVCNAVSFIASLQGIERDLFACALSANMRSIGNVDVDVVRAEYSKHPREGVDVQHLVNRKLRKMIRDVEEMVQSHHGLIGTPSSVRVFETSLFKGKLQPASVDAIVTSPPYGVESLSYLRTHLLSYRSLHRLLKHDPYEFSADIVGSEFLPAKVTHEVGASALPASPAMRNFFASLGTMPKKYEIRVKMMLQFFDDMHRCGKLFHQWLKPRGKVAFVIGNKLIDKTMIPTDRIVIELFENQGLHFVSEVKHKLKCNNSNSEVPWQERTIQDEFVLIFQKA